MESEAAAWRYRHKEGGDWRYVPSEDDCNPDPAYEREPLFTARPSGWISVEAVLPDLDVPVFLWDGEDVWVGARGDDADGWLWGTTYGNHYWNRKMQRWETSDNEADDDYQPTHWMPLPGPPATSTTEGEGDP